MKSMKTKAILTLLAGALIISAGVACKKGDAADDQPAVEKKADPMANKGIGPVKSIELGALDAKLAAKGKKIMAAKCLACHKMKERVVGPALAGVTKRRSPEWIMNMMLNTKEMVEKDPIASAMVAVYFTKMTEMGLSNDDARALLEYYREYDAAAK